MKCPLISSQYGAHNCVAPDCGFTDEAGHCLIKQALQCYVSTVRTKVAEERNQTEQLRAYFENIAPSGYRWPSDERIDTSPSFDNLP